MKALKRLRAYIRPYRAQFTLAIVLMVFTVAGDLLLPWLFGQAIDKGLSAGAFGTAIYYALLLVGVQGVRSILNYWQWIVQQRVGQNALRDLRNALYAQLQSSPQQFYRSLSTGDIMSRVTGDVDAVQEYLGWGYALQMASGMALVGALVLLLLLDWQLTMATLLPVAVLGFIVYLFDNRLGPTWEAERKQMGELTRVLQEFISGIRVVKAFAREPLEHARFNRQNEAARERNLRRARLEAYALPAVNLMIGLVFVILAGYGMWRVVNGKMTLGLFFSYQWYLWSLIWPVQISGWLINIRRRALAAAPRLFEILDTPQHIADPADAIPLPHVRGEVAFEHAAFAFEDQPDRPVLQELNLSIAAGEVVAVLGGTGSGKSSLINLVPRFQDVTAGRVTIDGIDVRSVALGDLRRHIGLVPQESFLFSASIRDNIAYGKPDATDDEIFEAARLAQAHQFIIELEDGYDTLIGERGVRLSGGQKQRLALARALLVDPAILVLDEATSAVDTQTEHAIQKALEQALTGRTSIIIAQRLSTIKHADRIVVLKDGRIVEMGTHAQLLRRGGEYSRIFALQYRADAAGSGNVRFRRAQEEKDDVIGNV